MPTGCCAVTKPGNLICSYIIHAIGPYYSSEDMTKAEELLSSCVINTLEMAKLLNVESLSIPAICTGIKSFQKNLRAEIIIRRVVLWFFL